MMKRLTKTLRSREFGFIAKASITIKDSAHSYEAVLQLRGAILFDQANQLKTFLNSALKIPANTWILDLGHLNLIGHKGLSVLLRFLKKLESRGSHITVAQVHPAITSALKSASGKFGFLHGDLNFDDPTLSN